MGYYLTAKKPTVSPTPTVKYQWLRNGVAVTGATGYRYKLGSKDKGKLISLRLTFSRTGYTTVSRTSAKTTAIK